MIQYWVLLKKTSLESLEQLCIAITPLYKKPSKQEACPLVRSKSIESIFIYGLLQFQCAKTKSDKLIQLLLCFLWEISSPSLSIVWDEGSGRQKQRMKKTSSIN